MSEMQISVTEDKHVTNQHIGVGIRAPEVRVIKREKHQTTQPFTALPLNQQELRVRPRGVNLR
jgi:hypothetical protein